jgi:hypothetical protein
LEIHLAADHSLLRSQIPLKEISAVETNCFSRIWFSTSRAGQPQGLEAFDDLFFFETSESSLAIIVGLDNWFSNLQRKQLLADLDLAAN